MPFASSGQAGATKKTQRDSSIAPTRTRATTARVGDPVSRPVAGDGRRRTQNDMLLNGAPNATNETLRSPAQIAGRPELQEPIPRKRRERAPRKDKRRFLVARRKRARRGAPALLGMTTGTSSGESDNTTQRKGLRSPAQFAGRPELQKRRWALERGATRATVLSDSRRLKTIPPLTLRRLRGYWHDELREPASTWRRS